MANFTRVRADNAAWANGTAVTGAELGQIDTNLSKCANFTDGCAVSPTAPVVIGGLYGLELSAPFSCSGTSTLSGLLNCTGHVTLGDSSADQVTCHGTLSCTAPVYFSDTVECTGTLSAKGPTNIGDSSSDACTVLATATFSSPVICNGSVTANGAVTLGNSSVDAITVTGTASFAQPITAALGARISALLSLGFQSRDLTASDVFTSPIGYVVTRFTYLNGSGRALTLNHSGFGEGTTIFLINEDSSGTTHVISVYDETEGLICSLQWSKGAVFTFSGARWHCVLKGEACP